MAQVGEDGHSIVYRTLLGPSLRDWLKSCYACDSPVFFSSSTDEYSLH